ncbi:efflux RND transporter permease subunit, partial [Nitrospirota bacterium]
MAGNSVAANLLMVALIAGGLFSALSIKQEVFPEYELDIISVSVSYPGTSPEEVEKGVVVAIEEEIRTHENVDRVTSTSFEGRASIVAELITGSDANKTLQDIKSALDRISSLPEEAERPIASLQSRRREVLRIALSGELEEVLLYNLAFRVQSELTSLPGITQVEVRGLREPEVKVEVSQDTLNSHGLILKDIAQRIRQYAIDIPAGGIKAQGGEVLLRTKERREFSSEFRDIPIILSDTGSALTLGDIAEIREGFAESDREAYYNGQRAALIYIYRTGEQTPIEISGIVSNYVKSLNESLPAGVDAIIYNDRSELYKDRLSLLLRNGLLGLFLVLISLGLLLEPRLAFWVAMGMPISILGSFIILKSIGGSINMVSMFAFIVTIGIIVDDAVVVGENIYHKRQSGKFTPFEASVTGVREMSAPVLVAVLTNIIAFIPLLLVTGSTGRFFSILPAVVISVFLISLVESLYVLPAHLNYPFRDSGKMLTALDRVPHRFSGYMEHFVSSYYSPAIKWALGARYLVVVGAAAVLVVAYAYWSTGWIDFSFRPRIETDRIDAEIELPFGSRIEEVRKIAGLVEEGGMRAIENSGGKGILTGVMTDIGRRGSNSAEVTFDLVSQGERDITTREFSMLWREEVGEIPGLEKLFFDYLAGPGGSSAINVELSHPEPRTLELAATELATALEDFSGVTDINDGFAQGKPQIDFKLSPEGRAEGLNSTTLGEQIRNAFYGAEALRLQRGQDEVKVMVRLPEEERSSLYDIENLLVSTGDGGKIPL